MDVTHRVRYATTARRRSVDIDNQVMPSPHVHRLLAALDPEPPPDRTLGAPQVSLDIS